MRQLFSNRPFLLILFAGLLLRLFFISIGAAIYFGRPNIYVDGDTSAWAYSFQNLWQHGVYTVDLDKEMGAFNRLPGYSFFLGFFYLLCGQDWQLTYKVVGWFQTLLDVTVIPLVFTLVFRLFNQSRVALIATALYAFYPFVMVWTPVCYSEYMSIFILLWGLYFLVASEHKYKLALAGLLLGTGALFRPQLLLFAPAAAVYVYGINRSSLQSALKRITVLAFCYVLAYASWPLRNYISYHKVIITQDLSGASNWSPDVIAYMQYMFAVKTDWFPQFTQIIENKEYEISPYAFASAEDSIKLLQAVDMAKNCSRGFSCWKGYWKELVPEEEDCGPELEAHFNELRSNIIKQYPFRYYVVIPINNLKKALFKLTLNDTKTFARKAASALFVYRTFLILLGLIGCFFLLGNAYPPLKWFAAMLIAYFLIVYIFLCAGTGPQTRNIEIRYFLQPDILLLIPAAWLIGRLPILRKSSVE